MFENMPGFLAKLVNAESETSRGKVGVEIVKNNGEIVGVNFKRQTIINFPQEDNQQALIAITQKIVDLSKSAKEKETMNIRLESKNGRITRMFITNECQENVA